MLSVANRHKLPVRRDSIGRTFGLLFWLYVFLASISLMGAAFKLFGKPFAEALVHSTSNPFSSLFIGVLVTSLVQSSSTTTSMVVGLVAAGTLPVRAAIPMIMGANIGTAVTATLVALGHVTRKEEFKRAFACACVHDFFNLIATLVLFPLEMATHFLERTATLAATVFSNFGGIKSTSPVKLIVKPVIHAVEYLFQDLLALGHAASGVCTLIVALFFLFISLRFMMTTMRGVIIRRAETALHKVLPKSGILGILVGAVVTASVQSSSITTSLLVPMAAAGIVTLEQVFPIILGANIGTTITALLASMTGNEAAVTIALVHLFFNVAGICVIYPFRSVRQIPIAMAEWLAELSSARKRYAATFILGVFFMLPGFLIYVFK